MLLIIQIYWYWALSLILCKPFLHPKNSHSPCFEPKPCLRAPSSNSAASAQATLEEEAFPIGSMGLVDSPTWMVDFYGKCTIHGWYGFILANLNAPQKKNKGARAPTPNKRSTAPSSQSFAPAMHWFPPAQQKSLRQNNHGKSWQLTLNIPTKMGTHLDVPGS